MEHRSTNAGFPDVFVSSRTDCIKRSLDSKTQAANSPKDPAFLPEGSSPPGPPAFLSSCLHHACCSAVSCSACKSPPQENTATCLQQQLHIIEWSMMMHAGSFRAFQVSMWKPRVPGTYWAHAPLWGSAGWRPQMSPPAPTSHISSALPVCESQNRVAEERLVAPSALRSDLSYQYYFTHRPCARACPYGLCSCFTFYFSKRGRALTCTFHRGEK